MRPIWPAAQSAGQISTLAPMPAHAKIVVKNWGQV
jgi:hypothetical protein